MNSNGAGKSTGSCDALEWCLWGVVPKGDHADSVVNEQAGKNTRVHTLLTDGPEYRLEVERFRKQGGKKSGMKFWVNGEDRTALDPKETQRLLELELGLDHQAFRASVVFGQNDRFYFADATDKDRWAIITILFEMEEIDEWQEGAKAIRSEIQTEAMTAEQHVVEAIAKRDAYLESVKPLMASSASWGAERDRRRASAEQRQVELVAYLQDTQTRLQALDGTKAQLAEVRAIPEESFRPAQLADLEASEAELAQRQGALVGSAPQPPAEIAELRERQLFHERAKAEAGALWKQLEGDVVKRQTEINRVSQVGVGRCRECGQDVTEAHLEREVARLQAELEEVVQTRQRTAEEGAAIGEQIAEVASSILALEEEHRKAMAAHQASATAVHEELNRVRLAHRALEQKWQADLTAHRNRISVLEQELAHEPTLQGYITQTEANIAQTVENLAAIGQEANPFAASLADVDGETERLELAVQRAEMNQEHIRDRLQLADFWVEAFGPKGVKSYILDTRLPELTEAANAGVLTMTGGTHWVQLDTVTAGRTTKTVRNQINVRVFKYNTDGSVVERGYKSYSGGERQRVSLGIDFGLAWLVASRAKKRYGEVFLDELFRHIDKAGKEAVVDFLRQLGKDKSSVFVIEHDEEFREHFDSEIVIQKVHGQSRYLEGDNGQGASTGPQEKPRRKKAVNRVPSAAPVPQA
jgi:DNA repair exonuclease SbcCD ATPase subunit